MKIIVISSPVNFQGEHDILHALFEEGLNYFHIRKPDSTKKELEEFIQKVKSGFISRIIIHSHYDLIKKYNLKGIHFPEKIRRESEVKEIIQAAKKRRLSVSSSVHTMEEISSCNLFDYVFLSPVYPSISKPGYSGNITLSAYQEWKKKNTIQTKVIALGGINPENCMELREAGFDGIGLLGTIWNEPNELAKSIRSFSDIKAKVDC